MEKDISVINKEFKYQKIEWPVASVFWTFIAIVLMYGLLGGFGDGESILNRQTVPAGESLIEYDKYLRVEKSFTMKIFLGENTENCSVAFNKEYIDRVQIIQTIPEPQEVEINDDRIIYRFKTHKSGTITFFNDPLKMGTQQLELEVNKYKVSVLQYIYF